MGLFWRGGREIAARAQRSGSWAAMRYNEKELQALSRQPAELAAELGMRGPKKGSGEWGKGCEPGAGRTGVPVGAGWAVTEPARARPVSTVVKRRLVKLVVNFLFYFRTDEAEVGRREGGPRARVGELGSPDGPPIRLLCPQPVGALLLEHCRVTQEEPSGFSISECGGRGPELRPAPPHEQSRALRLTTAKASRAFTSVGEHCPLRVPPLRTAEHRFSMPGWGPRRIILSYFWEDRVCRERQNF